MRVLVADDHALFRDGIVSLLEAAGFEVVGQAGDGESAVAMSRQYQPDVVLLDVNMPQMTGLVALRHIKEELPKTKVVMLTVSDSDEDLFDAMEAGAHGYLLKSLNADEFLEMVEGLERDEMAITRQTSTRLIKGFTATSSATPTAPQLTERELEVLQLVAQGLPNKAIALQASVSENTVKYHMKNIMQKLQVQNRTEAVTFAINAGLISSDSPT